MDDFGNLGPREIRCGARVAELADALDLGSSGPDPVGVRVPPLARFSFGIWECY